MNDVWRPEQYELFRAQRSQPFFDLLALVERDGAPLAGPRIVDLGCGTGELSAEAHRTLGASGTLGIDRSAAMLAEASAHSGPRLTFEPGDIASFPSSVHLPFDLVLSNAALQWVPDHESVLARWSGALSEHGQLAVQVPANSDHPAYVAAAEVAEEAEFAEAFAASPAGAPPPDHADRVLTPERYATLLDELGFTRQHVRLQVYAHQLASSADVVEWLRGTSLTRFEAVLAADDFERFVARYRHAVLERVGDHSPYFYAFKRILIWGRR